MRWQVVEKTVIQLNRILNAGWGGLPPLPVLILELFYLIKKSRNKYLLNYKASYRFSLFLILSTIEGTGRKD